MRDLCRRQTVEEVAQSGAGAPQASARLLAYGIVPPNQIRQRRPALQPRRRLAGEACVLGQRLGAVPGEKGVDAGIELPGRPGIEVEIAPRLPAQPGIGIVVGEAERAAARGERKEQDRREPPFHQ